MANTNFPGGAEPIKYENGKELSSEEGALLAANAVIGYNELLEMGSDGCLIQATATSTTLVGISAEHKDANSGGNIKYYPIEGLIFKMQSNSADIDAQTDFDLTYAVTTTTENTTTHRSASQIAGATSHATDYPITIRRLAPATDTVGNALGLYVKLECKANPACIF